MVCLGIDTSGETLSVGLSDGGRVLGERTTPGERPHSVVILGEIEALLAEAEIARPEVFLVSVTGGPGRYTALRVGMATAKGLAFAWKIPMIRVSTLEAMACSLTVGSGTVVPVLDARRRLVYAAIFEGREGKVTRVAEDRALSYADAAAEIPDGALLVGDGVPLVEPFLREKGVTFETRPCMIRGGVVAMLGKRAFASRGYDEILEGPTYIRTVEVQGSGVRNNP